MSHSHLQSRPNFPSLVSSFSSSSRQTTTLKRNHLFNGSTKLSLTSVTPSSVTSHRLGIEMKWAITRKRRVERFNSFMLNSGFLSTPYSFTFSCGSGVIRVLHIYLLTMRRTKFRNWRDASFIDLTVENGQRDRWLEVQQKNGQRQKCEVSLLRIWVRE